MRVQDYGSCSLPGTRYGSLNQDFCFVETVEGQLVKAYISAVLDGHGMLGEKCAKKAGRSICSSFRQLYQEQGCLKLREVQESLILAFEEAHKKGQSLYSKPPSSYEYPKGSAACELYELSKVKGAWHYVCNQGATPLEFGTTCTACLLSGDELAVAHVGDSAAVLGFVDDENEDYAAERVTRSHTWTDRGEAGRVQGMRGVTVTEDGYLRVLEGQWQGQEIATSRALGHHMLSNYGVIPTPEVEVLQLEPRHCCLIMASDGVWDHFSADEAVRAVMDSVDNGSNAQGAAEELASRAVELAKDSNGSGSADNTTAVVFLMHS
uniref:Protein phosphatase n=1 Tax=Tetraselmis sp. GSL018 TaxID=582737 RepID=A0A061QQJ1_9CHLO